VPLLDVRLHSAFRDRASVDSALADERFDEVVDWIAFTPEHVEADVERFRSWVEQYIFISSASAYQTPPLGPPVVESTPLSNPYWEYSGARNACGDRRDKGDPDRAEAAKAAGDGREGRW